MKHTQVDKSTGKKMKLHHRERLLFDFAFGFVRALDLDAAVFLALDFGARFGAVLRRLAGVRNPAASSNSTRESSM